MSDEMSDSGIVLGTHMLEVEIHPAQGGRIGRFRAIDGGEATELFTPCAMQARSSPAYGAFPMIPYAHRIRQAAFTFCGHRYSLPTDSLHYPHAIHGLCRDIPWQVVAMSRRGVHLRAHYEGHHWPWRICADQQVELTDNRLTITLSLTNLGKSSMPAGLGFHPYFSATDASYVSFSADVQWVCDDNRFPLDMQRGRQDLKLVRQDLQEKGYFGHFSEWNGYAEIGYPTGTVEMRTTSELSHLVCFMPEGAQYLCVEPSSHLINELNSSAAGDVDTGVRTLCPGEVMRGQIEMRWCKAIGDNEP